MKEYSLTKEEKIKFLAMLEYTRIDAHIKDDINHMKKCAATFGIAAIIGGWLTVLSGLISGTALSTMLSIVLPIDIMGSLTIASVASFRSVKNFFKNSKKIKIETNGKITYRDYKKLIKDGTIERWKSEYREEINNKIMEIDGCSLDSFNLENCKKEELVKKLTTQSNIEKINDKKNDRETSKNIENERVL